MASAPSLERQDFMPLGELGGASIGGAQCFEEGVWGKRDLEPRPMSDVIADTEQPVLKGNCGTFADEENRVEVTDGQGNTPPANLTQINPNCCGVFPDLAGGATSTLAPPVIERLSDAHSAQLQQYVQSHVALFSIPPSQDALVKFCARHGIGEP